LRTHPARWSRICFVAASLAASFIAARVACAAERVILPADVTPERYEISVEPDAAKLTFEGTANIIVDVHRPTASITLNAADLGFRSVALSGEVGAPRISLDAARETATLRFASPITPGRHLLRITYGGKINENAAGLFALDYDTARGKRRALFTQFENSDARRFMPCWDEPARKAVFWLSAVVPTDHMAV